MESKWSWELKLLVSNKKIVNTSMYRIQWKINLPQETNVFIQILQLIKHRNLTSNILVLIVSKNAHPGHKAKQKHTTFAKCIEKKITSPNLKRIERRKREKDTR